MKVYHDGTMAANAAATRFARFTGNRARLVPAPKGTKVAEYRYHRADNLT